MKPRDAHRPSRCLALVLAAASAVRDGGSRSQRFGQHTAARDRPDLAFRLVPKACRLSLLVHGRRLQGLPALCIALCRRRDCAWLVGLCVAPLAVAIENMREAHYEEILQTMAA